jgi:hypothetical protein
MSYECQGQTIGNNCPRYDTKACTYTCEYAIMLDKEKEKFRVKRGIERFYSKYPYWNGIESLVKDEGRNNN